MLKILRYFFPLYFESSYEGEKYVTHINSQILRFTGFLFLSGLMVLLLYLNTAKGYFLDNQYPTDNLVFMENYVNIEKLADAISGHETCGCTCGTGITHNNCFGIKENGEFVAFSSKERSYQSFYWNWEKHYNNEFPKKWHAKKWSGNDRADAWLENVTFFYRDSLRN